jgi:hypothetical protein
MKNLLTILFVGLSSIFVFTGCEDGLTDINFDLNYETTFVIDETATAGEPSEFISPNVATSTAQEFEQNGVSLNTLKSAKLKSLVLTIDSPDSANFDNIASAELYLKSDQQPLTLVANVDNIPEGESTIEVGTEDVNLIEFLKGDYFNFIARAVTKDGVTREMVISAKMVIGVVANPLSE